MAGGGQMFTTLAQNCAAVSTEQEERWAAEGDDDTAQGREAHAPPAPASRLQPAAATPPFHPRRPSSPSETADTGRRVSTVPGRLCVPRPSGYGRQGGPGSSRWELVRVGRERRVRSGILPGADLTPRGFFCLPSSLLPLSGVT